MAERFDIAVIGGGPGGYVAAIRAAQLGARTAIVEKDRLGGTCLVRGCIPTKALLQSSELWTRVQRGAEFGVQAKELSFDWPAAQKRKTAVVDQLVKGVEALMKANRIQVFAGQGVLGGGGRVEVGREAFDAGDVIIATGSVPARLRIPGAELAIDSDQILELKELPPRLAVIGGGVVGMEWGALFAALGSQVSVLELLPQILPMVEADLVAAYRRHFEGLGGAIHTEAKVSELRQAKSGLEVHFSKGGEGGKVEADQVLLATGRLPYTAGLGAEAAGVELERGRVRVDQHLRTAADHVWAIGDVIGGIMLAHVASYEGVCAVENIATGRLRVPDYHAAPNCIYTDPEIAHVGLSEKEAREAGHQVLVGRFPFAASGRALTLGEPEGFVKVVASERDRKVLGVHLVGPRVTDLVAEATVAVQQGLTLDQLELTIHAHPTLAESLLEAALAAEGRAVHIANRAPRPAPVQTISKEVKPEVAKIVEAKKPEDRSQERAWTAIDTSPEAVALKKENRGRLLQLHRLMYLIRRFEERVQEQYTKAKIGGYCHLNLGEEATVVGGILALKAQDYIFTNYREHGHAIARGVEPRAVMAELFGRETGTSHGRGGSMHIFDSGLKFMGGYGIVGGHLPLATGAAFAIKYQKKKDIVFCMFGDGATNIGAFHESLNYAKVQHLPVVWYCVNNQYGMGTAVDRASAVKEIYKRACAYDIESIQIDGMDLLQVLERTREVVEKTRADGEPRFIESVCYRFKGHSVVDPDKYRSEQEKAKWRQSDPLVRFEHQLREAKIAGEEDFKKAYDQVESEVEAAIRFADESPNPPVEELFRFVYSGEWEKAASA